MPRSTSRGRLAPVLSLLTSAFCLLTSPLPASVTLPASEDTPLLHGEFDHWNFGSSPLLEAGTMGGIYTEHRATSLLRFDLPPSGLSTISSATLRLYKPKDFIQSRPLKVY